MKLNTQDVILGMLMKRSLTGYDMKMSFEQLFSHFFDASYGTIYPTLSRMEKDGYITKESVVQAGKPNKNVYTITDKGKEAFAAYLNGPIEKELVKSDFLMRLYFGEFIGEDKVVEWLEAAIAEARETARKLETECELYVRRGMSPTQEICIRIGIELDLRRAEVLEEGLQKIRNGRGNQS